MTTMPWGKWRGRGLHEIPASYLCWVLENCPDAGVCLRWTIRQELANRFASPVAVTATPVSADVRGIVRAWYRQLARRYHPDSGGDTRAFQVLNEANARLLEMLDNPPQN